MKSRHVGQGQVVMRAAESHSQFSYLLSNSDLDSLAPFLMDIVPLVSDPFQMEQANTDVEIAHRRYLDALFQVNAPERMNASAIMALEALFLKNESELTHRLAQRVSVFLRILGTQTDARATYANVNKSYKIRSTFIHGGSLKQKDKPLATSLSSILVDYARQCVLARLQQTISKDDLLTDLDNAMIDPSTASHLQPALNSATYK